MIAPSSLTPFRQFESDQSNLFSADAVERVGIIQRMCKPSFGSLEHRTRAM